MTTLGIDFYLEDLNEDPHPTCIVAAEDQLKRVMERKGLVEVSRSTRRWIDINLTPPKAIYSIDVECSPAGNA